MGLTTLACLFASLIAPRVASAAPALGGSGIATGVDTTTETSTPITNVYDWAVGGATRDLIHPSCNATERLQLERALNDTMKLAQHAKEHILRFGNSSHFYVRYFGDAPSAEPIGWFERVVNADRSGMTFRCDDPDDNCRLPGWGGHWRGENATQETVICELSFATRRPLEALCGLGYTVAAGRTNFYFASDLLHRLFHIPRITEGVIDHYTHEEGDRYNGVLELAKTNSIYAVRNSDSLQYFALDVYAYDIALPGQGCTTGILANSTSSLVSASATTSAFTLTYYSGVFADTPATTSNGVQTCHTHADGVSHCG